jgi:hypothetical protein
MTKGKTNRSADQLVFDEPELNLHHPVHLKRKLPSASSPVLDRMVSTVLDMRENPDAVERAYMARQLVQCTLPHSNPGDVPVWRRQNGALTLSIRPYIDRKTDKALYPYGTIPRLLLFWLVTEATQKRSRHIRLGNSLDAFMKAVGLNPRTGGGKRGDAKRLHNQMERLFRAVISFDDEGPCHATYLDMQIAPRGAFWWDPKRSLQDNLWESWIELGEDFYEAITVAPVPIDLRALRALKQSPLALDLYSLLTYTAFVVSKRKRERTIPWDGLHAQMGSDYAQMRNFRAKVLLAIRKIRLVYPELRVRVTREGLTVEKSAVPAISPKKD